MPHISTDEKALSEVDRDLKNSYLVASKLYTKARNSRDLSKFVLARFLDDIVEDVPLSEDEVKNSREMIKEKMKGMKILEVGKKCGFADYFGHSDHYEDLFFINSAMKGFSKHKDTEIAKDYDFIYFDWECLPSKRKIYEIMQDKWDKEFNNGEKSYWGVDDHAYSLFNNVKSMIGRASYARKYGKNDLDLNGIDTPENIKLFGMAKENVDGFADLNDIDYYKEISKFLKNGGVAMDYDSGRTRMNFGKDMKLLDIHGWHKRLPEGGYTEKFKQTFKKL